VAGFSGTAYAFAGQADVRVPHADDLNPGSADITLTLHLKTTQVPARPDWDLIRKGVFSDPGEYKMEYQPSGQASCGFGGTTSFSEIMDGPALNDGAWHTVQCVKTASAIALVVDGQTFSKKASIGSIANVAPVVIGAHADGGEFFQGTLDEASIDVGTDPVAQAPASPTPGPAPTPTPEPQPSPPAPANAPAASPPAVPNATRKTQLTVSSTTRTRTRLVIRGRLTAGASAGRLRLIVTRRTRHHGTIRMIARARGGRSGRWRAELALTGAARNLHRFDVSVAYLGDPGYAPAKLRVTAHLPRG
jgi:hypothetical protein